MSRLLYISVYIENGEVLINPKISFIECIVERKLMKHTHTHVHAQKLLSSIEWDYHVAKSSSEWTPSILPVHRKCGDYLSKF